MQVSVRSYLMSGVVLVGAGAMVISPVRPPLPDIHVPALNASSAAVELSAFVNPIEEWAQVISTSVNNIGGLGGLVAANPAPILQQILANQIGYANQIGTIGTSIFNNIESFVERFPGQVQQAIDQLAAGDFAGAVATTWGVVTTFAIGALYPLLNLTVPADIAQHLANLVPAFTQVAVGLGFGVLATAGSVVSAFGATGQAFIDAVNAGDLVTALSVVVNAPATMTNAFLNGYGFNQGLLSPYGPLGGLIRSLDTIAIALGKVIPPPPEEPEETEFALHTAKTVSVEATLKVNELPASVAVANLVSPLDKTLTVGTATESAQQPAESSGAETVEVSDTAAESSGAETVEVSDGAAESTEETDETTGSEESEETTGTDETDDSDESNGPKSSNGSTDLSGDNKAEPGKTGSDTDTGSTGTGTGTGSSTNGSGNGAGGSNGGSDGGSDS